MCHFPLFNYFKKWEVYNVTSFQKDETKYQSGQNDIPKNTEIVNCNPGFEMNSHDVFQK